MRIDSNQNNLSFNGGIKVKGITLDPEKMKDVLKTYGKLTKNYSDDLFISRDIIYKNGVDGEVAHHSVLYSTEKCPYLGWTVLIENFEKWFNNTDAKDIATTFARIFQFGKLTEKHTAKINKLDTNIAQTNRSFVLNSHKAEITENPIFQTLAENNKARINTLKAEKSKLMEAYAELKSKILTDKVSNILELLCF